MVSRFTIRVYGILISKDCVLLSDEFVRGHFITKFPGGGLQFGEGTLECLQREFMEELNLPVSVGDHFYTTDFFVSSVFDPHSQVISVYYNVHVENDASITVSDTPHDYPKKEGGQSFRWKKISDIQESDLTLIIDQKVAGMLRKYTS